MQQDFKAQQAVLDFVSQFYTVTSLEPVLSDASLRCYWRLKTPDANFVVMDSPPEVADIAVFAQLGRWLSSYDIPVPAIYEQDQNGRFLILEDLGNTSLYSALQQNQSIQVLKQPIAALVPMSQLPQADLLPIFTRELLIQEAKLFDEWCLSPLDLGVNPGEFNALYELLADSATQQEQGFVHRDYHSMNIHFCPDKPFGVGIIDFQDALWGPKGYDLISLLLDRYITWPEHQLFEVIESFRVMTKSPKTPSDFLQQILWISLQRNLRILGVFHRLEKRDHKPIYMNYVPQKAWYCRMVFHKYDELKPYAQLFDRLCEQAQWFKGK